MKPLHEQTLNEQSLMPRDWLRRRLTRLVHKGQRGAPFRPTVTLVDISNWFSVDYTVIRNMEDGRLDINDKWQVSLSQFFYLLDMGFIEIRVDMKSRRKTWARVTPTEPPCKAKMPRVDFLAAKLKFD
jgi:hypothetical protein